MKPKQLAKEKLIVETAKNLFLEKNIRDVSMEEIAKKTGLGVASLYRYFRIKNNLVIKVAEEILGEITNEFINSSLEGVDAIEDFYNTFYLLYKNRPNVYKLVFEFDLMMREYDINELQNYKSLFDNCYNFYKINYLKGYNEHKFRMISDLEIFYQSSCHALLNLCKHLCFEGDLFHQKDYGEEEIKKLIQIFLEFIKKEK